MSIKVTASASKPCEVLLTYLKSIKRAVVFDSQHVVVDRKDVAVSGEQVRQVKCFRLSRTSQMEDIRYISEDIQVHNHT